MNPTITMCITNACNLNCSIKTEGHNCIAGTNNNGRDAAVMLDLNLALEWREKFLPNSPVHISGGEPFLHPDIKEGLINCVDRGIDTTVFSNGTLLLDNSWCYELPLKWCLTYHKKVRRSFFLKNIEKLKDKQHLICEIFTTKTPEKIQGFDSFNTLPIKANSGYYNFGEKINIKNSCPNHGILLIGTRGEIFSCSNPSIQYGDVYTMTFDKKRAEQFRCHAKKYPNKCHTMQNAYLFSQMKG